MSPASVGSLSLRFIERREWEFCSEMHNWHYCVKNKYLIRSPMVYRVQLLYHHTRTTHTICHTSSCWRAGYSTFDIMFFTSDFFPRGLMWVNTVFNWWPIITIPSCHFFNLLWGAINVLKKNTHTQIYSQPNRKNIFHPKCDIINTLSS